MVGLASATTWVNSLKEHDEQTSRHHGVYLAMPCGRENRQSRAVGTTGQRYGQSGAGANIGAAQGLPKDRTGSASHAPQLPFLRVTYIANK